MLGKEMKENPGQEKRHRLPRVALAFLDGRANGSDSFGDASLRYMHKFEAELAVGVLMNLLKLQALFEADAAGCGE